MIRNYIKIALRHLWRHKGFSLINIIGLAIGMTAFFLIAIYVKFELSYNDFHQKADQIYRVNADIKSAEEILKVAITSPPMGPAIKADFPEVIEQTRLLPAGLLVNVNNRPFQENAVSFAEPSLFKVFSFSLIKGNAALALTAPYSVVLTQSTAIKYFGQADPMGETLLINGKYPSVVTGVMKDVPANSTIKFDLLCSISTLSKMHEGMLSQWGNFGNTTFLLLPKGYDAGKLQARFPAFLKSHISESDRKLGLDYALSLTALEDTYLDPRPEGGETGSLSNIYIFAIVALFILLIAAINFINLTTARATERAKEVGVRKVIGAARHQLTLQFLGESVIICLVSFVLTVILVSIALPLFNQLAGKIISPGILEHGYIFILLLVSLLIGLVAGIYPALTLSGFKPIVILKGRFNTSVQGVLLRKGLVVFQFTTSIVLIVTTIIVYRQLNFMREQPLGFQKDQMVTVNFGNDEHILKHLDYFKSEFKAIPHVLATTTSSGIPGSGSANAHSEFENRHGDMQSFNINLYEVDYNFIQVYGMKIVAGRAFSKDFATDSTNAVIINEATVKSMGFASPNDAVGKRFSQWGREGKIIGVIKDFHYRSLAQNVLPLNLRINPENTETLTLKISSENIPGTVAAIESKWKQLVPQRPFNYTFLNDNFNKQYATEVRFGAMFLYFAILAIFISCLGLLGLASYSTLQRTREIGIRKVLGANVTAIVHMLSKDFLQLVFIAALIAFPVAWFVMNVWLQDFAYRITISWWIFAVAGVLAFFIAVTTVSFQAIKAALANPVKSLRSE